MSVPYCDVIMEQRRRLLFSGIRLVVLDFDCTSTSIHLFDHQGPIILEEVIEVIPFRNFAIYLLSIGIQVAVATYGKKEIVLQLIREIFPKNSPFDENNVLSPQDISQRYQVRWREGYIPPPGYNKNTMLKILQGDLSEREVLLLDDSETNIKTASEAGYRTIQIPSCKGFFQTIVSTFKGLMLSDPITFSNPRGEAVEHAKKFIQI